MAITYKKLFHMLIDRESLNEKVNSTWQELILRL